MNTLPRGRPVNWRDRIPLPFFFVGVFAIWFVAQVAFYRHWSAPVHLASGVVLALAVTAGFGMIRHRLGNRGMTIGDAMELRRALRRGELPDDPVQRAAVPDAVRRMRTTSWFIVIGYPLIFGTMFVISLVLLATGPDRLPQAGFALFFGAALVVGTVLGIRWLRRAREIERRLAVRQPARTEPG